MRFVFALKLSCLLNFMLNHRDCIFRNKLCEMAAFSSNLTSSYCGTAVKRPWMCSI